MYLLDLDTLFAGVIYLRYKNLGRSEEEFIWLFCLRGLLEVIRSNATILSLVSFLTQRSGSLHLPRCYAAIGLGRSRMYIIIDHHEAINLDNPVEVDKIVRKYDI